MKTYNVCPRIEVKMRREIDRKPGKMLCNPLHKVHAGVCYKRLYESAIEHQQCAGQRCGGSATNWLLEFW